MRNVRLRGVVFHDGHNVTTECELGSPECQSVEIEWDGGSALLNEDRLGYTTEEYADEQWAKTMAAARLMAAAPDLLAALTNLHEACEYWEDQNDPVLVEARRAIAKAKGGKHGD